MATRRYIVSSDVHAFQGRIFDLSMPLNLGFDSWEEVEQYPDATYVLKVYPRVEYLMRRGSCD